MAISSDIKNISPFNVYDYFGYIFPAVFFVASTLYVFNRSIFTQIERYRVIYEDNKFLLAFFSIVFFIVIVYVIGHAIATLSHIFYDRLIVGGIIGYPISRLLHIEKKKMRAFSTWAYSLILLFVFLMFSVPFIMLVIKHVTNSEYDFSLFVQYERPALQRFMKMICWIIIGLITSRVVMTIIKLSLDEEGKNLKYGKQFRLYLSSKIELIYNKTFGLFIRLMDRVLNTDRSFSKDFADNYKQYFKTRFGIEPETADTECYWLAYYDSISANPAFSQVIVNWLHLYSFARNMCCACFLVCTLIIHQLLFSVSVTKGLFVLFSLNYVLGIIFFLRYWVLYSSYFSKSVVRVFYVLESSKQREGGQ
jgi:hypothetical protein